MRCESAVSAALVAAVLALAGCGGGTTAGGGASTGLGTLRVSLTDAPSCGYAEVNVTVLAVRVHQSSSAADDDAGWQEVSLPVPRRIDLLTLTNGVREELGQVALPAGKYTQMRLVLADNGGGAAPYANSVRPLGGAETALDTPSAQQSGLKMNVDVDVPADKVADFVIDFDACKSVVKRGNSGKYNLKPVLRGTVVLSDAGLRVVGYVADAIAGADTRVSLQFDGMPVKETVPDPSGQFVLYPVPVGNYDLVVTAAGHVTAVMTGVPVVDTAYTYVGSPTLRIAPPAATMRVVTGSVTPSTASVRALQHLTGGPTVEIAWTAADADTGGFGFALPIEAPIRTAYAAPLPTAYAFVADAGAAAKYTLEAESAGALETQAIDVTAPVPPVTFVFP